MEPRIETISPIQLVGKRMHMTLADNKTPDLWRAFMPYRQKVAHRVNEGMVYEVILYEGGFNPAAFHIHSLFEKWAAAEVHKVETLPDGMEHFLLPGGTYAVFQHKGPAHTFGQTARFIYGVWLPRSNYRLDDRPHFNRLPEGYRPDDPEAEEEVWIPVRAGNSLQNG
jgi:AraC family transcriptional regulator